MANAADDFFLNSGGDTVPFENVGDTYTGTVVSMELMQQTDFQTKQPAVKKDGSPKMQAVVRFDDGKKIFAKGLLQRAIGTALRMAGLTSLIGSQLTVTVTALSPNPFGGKPIKQWSATVAPGAATTPVDDDEIPF